MPSRRLALGFLALAPLAFGGCDPRVGADPGQAYLLDRLNQDTAEADAAAKAGKNVSFPCHAILATVPSFKNAGEDTRNKLENAKRICHDGALAYAKAQVARLEAARKAREDLVEECFDLDHALDVLTALGATEPTVASLQQSMKKLCP